MYIDWDKCTKNDLKSLLGLDIDFTVGVVNQIIKYMFTDPRGAGGSGKKNFDHKEDYRYIVPSFVQLYNVNLERESISWFEYRTMLEGCFLNTCTIRKIVEIRSAELPKDPKAKERMLDLKATYRLKSGDSEGISGLAKALEGVAK